MSGKLQRTYIAWHDAWVESSRELTEKHVLPPQVHMNVITCPTPPHPCIHAPTGQPQTSMSFLRKFTWTLLHAPPHPTPPHPCIHAPTGSHRQACPSSASSHERYYMPHPTPPRPPDVYKTQRPSKGCGPTIFQNIPRPNPTRKTTNPGLSENVGGAPQKSHLWDLLQIRTLRAVFTRYSVQCEVGKSHKVVPPSYKFVYKPH